MAITFSLPTSFAVDATYWAPIDGKFVYRAGNLSLRYGGWADQAAYEAGAQPLVMQTHVFDAAAITAVLGEGAPLTNMTIALMNTMPLFQPPPEPPVEEEVQP